MYVRTYFIMYVCILCVHKILTRQKLNCQIVTSDKTELMKHPILYAIKGTSMYIHIAAVCLVIYVVMNTQVTHNKQSWHRLANRHAILLNS